MTKRRSLTLLACRHDVTDLHRTVTHNHAVNQQFYQSPSLGKGELSQRLVDPFTKRLDSFCQSGRIHLILHLRLQLSQLPTQPFLHSR